MTVSQLSKRGWIRPPLVALISHVPLDALPVSTMGGNALFAKEEGTENEPIAP